MPTVVIASPKGGAGKSTTAILLGTELAHAGASVVMLDCDPNHSLTLWADRAPLPDRIQVLSSVTESDIVKSIKQHDTDGQIVVVDLEGVASRLVSRAISQADLVITPMRSYHVGRHDWCQSASAHRGRGRSARSEDPHAVVFTMTKAVRSKQHSGIAESLAAQGVDLIDPPLLERAAFSALFEFGGNLRNMPAQGNMDGAIENAALFAQAVYKRLAEGV